jgi:hypothetical protein
LAIWLATSSIAQVTKSAKCMSTTGTSPVMAAPIAEPTMAALRDRRVQDAVGAELRAGPSSPERHAEHDVLADAVHARIAPHPSRSARLSASPKSITATSVAPGSGQSLQGQ